jgi:hypothetical protein
LLPAGITAIKQMMRHGMLIDIDYMSQAALRQTLAIAETFRYPLNSGHNTLRGSVSPHTERNLTLADYQKIGQLHGMAGVGSAGINAVQWLSRYQNVLTAMGQRTFATAYGTAGNAVAAGFGTDMNGLQRGMPPRPVELDRMIDTNPRHAACAKNCKGTPPMNITGGVLPAPAARSSCLMKCDRQIPTHYVKSCLGNCGAPPVFAGHGYTGQFPASVMGTRTWDYRVEGVAHYGMLWDFAVDVAGLPGGANVVDNNLMYGADYFYHTWQIAEQRSKAVH